MTKHTDDLANAELPDHFETFGEEFTYTPREGAARTITAIVLPETSRRENTGRRRVEMRELLIQVYRDPQTPIYGGVDKPQERDQFVRASDLRDPPVPLMFQEVEDADPVCATFRLLEAPRTVRGGYREENRI